MQLKNRLNHLEQRAKALNAAARRGAFDLDFESMSDEEIDTLLKNLLIAMGRPEGAVIGVIWDKLLYSGLAGLTPEEKELFIQYVQEE